MKNKSFRLFLSMMLILSTFATGVLPVSAGSSFRDVADNAYYAEPVAWAVEKEITNGTSDTTFSPDDGCTRGQVVTFLWRAAGKPDASLSDSFTDVAQDAYYSKAVSWAVQNEITQGVGDHRFDPDATCTRGQIVTFLWRYKGKPEATTDSGFSDVLSAMYYAAPVTWAVQNAITQGVGNHQFAPEDTCTRGQIVTFLYRAKDVKGSSTEDPNPAIAETRDSVFAIADPTTDAGQARLEEIASGIVDYWVDDNGTADDSADDWCNVVVTQNDPIYLDIQQGMIQSGDTLFFPQSEFFAVDVALVYDSHDDRYADWMDYSSTDYEVLHMKYADFSDLLEENETFTYSADSFDEEDPVAFTWTPGSGISDDASLQSEDAQLTDSGNNTVSGKGFQSQNLKVENMIDVDLLSQSKHAGLKLDDIVLFDADGKGSTSADQITLSGQVMMENITVDSALHEDFQWSDPLPKQIMLKLSYEMNNNLKVELGGEIANISDAMDDMKAYARENFNTQGHNNVRHLKLLGIDLSGVDMSNSIILGAVGANLTPGSAPKIGIRAIRSQSIYYQAVPSVVILFTMDLDGSVNATVVGEYTYNSYVEKGFNLQKNGYDGGNGTVESNQGKENISMPFDRQLNIYDVNAKSASERNQDPVSKFTLTAEAKAELGIYSSVSVGMMVAGIIPGQIKGSIGPDIRADIKGQVTCASDTGFAADGSVEITGDLVVKAEANVMVKAEKGGKELKKIGKDWKSEPYSILSLSWKWPSKTDTGTVDLGSANVGDYVTFGHYEQDNNIANGKEAIEWKVLDKANGRALLLSKYGLDCKRYDDSWNNVTWETCTMRSWLNIIFLNEAFSASEQSAIPTVTLSNPDNPNFGTTGGNSTNDRVFLLSLQEMQQYFNLSDMWADYDGNGHNVTGDTYSIGGSREVITSPTDYAIAQGAYTYSSWHDAEGRESCWWWLRSPGSISDYASRVDYDGYVYALGHFVYYDYLAVRPALWVNLKS